MRVTIYAASVAVQRSSTNSRSGWAYHGWYTARPSRSSHVMPTIDSATIATPSSAHTRSRTHRASPTSRTLAASTLNQASVPSASAAMAMNHDATGPHVIAELPAMSKNVGSALDRVVKSSASIAFTVATTFSPLRRSDVSVRRSEVSRAV